MESRLLAVTTSSPASLTVRTTVCGRARQLCVITHLRTGKDLLEARLSLRLRAPGDVGLSIAGARCRNGWSSRQRCVRRPRERRGIIDEDVSDRRHRRITSRDRKGPHPVRREARRILFVKRFSIDAIRKSFQRHRAIAKVGEQERRDPQAIVDYLSLGKFCAWIETLSRFESVTARLPRLSCASRGMPHFRANSRDVRIRGSHLGNQFDRR